MVTRKRGCSLLLVVLLFPPLIAVGTAKASSDCSLATLRGAYGVLEQGTIVGQFPGLPPPPFPFANTANGTYDGAGNFSGTFTASFGGAIVPGTFTGTYTVKPDCTYSDEFTPLPGLVAHHQGTITGSGVFQQIAYIYKDAGLIISGTAKKAPPTGCSLASLKGVYGGLEQGEAVPGAQLPGLPPGPWPFAASGLDTYDGAGNVSGTFTVSVGGTIVPGTFNGKYFVNPDCTYSDEFTPLPGVTVHHAGTIAGSGVFRKVLFIYSDSGTVIVGTHTRQR